MSWGDRSGHSQALGLHLADMVGASGPDWGQSVTAQRGLGPGLGGWRYAAWDPERTRLQDQEQTDKRLIPEYPRAMGNSSLFAPSEQLLWDKPRAHNPYTQGHQAGCTNPGWCIFSLHRREAWARAWCPTHPCQEQPCACPR